MGTKQRPKQARGKAKAPPTQSGTGPRPSKGAVGRSAGRPVNRKARRAEQSRRSGKPGWGFRVAEGTIWTLILLGLGAGVLTANLPEVAFPGRPEASVSVAVHDASGALIDHRGLTWSHDVTLNDLPAYVPQAFLAIEDHRFYDHGGIDPVGLGRAIQANLAAGRIVQGGSTITQQLARTLFLTQDRTLIRKLEEAVLAIWLETRLTKDEILSLYLNRVYFGAGTNGIDAAARRYFGKPAHAIGLAEAAMLAGLLKAPSRYAPTNNAEGAMARARLVLRRMEETGFITRDQRLEAAGRHVPIRSGAPAGAQYFVDWVMARLPFYVGRIDEPLIVHTTLDLRLQREAEAALARVLDGPEGWSERRGVGEAALVALDGTGAVRAMVGGRSYVKSAFNRAIHARRQPGSAFKPFVFLTALKQGLRPDDLLADRPVRIGQWAPGNFTGEFKGWVTLGEALAQSLNAATVRLGEKVGRDNIIRTARSLGLETPLAPHPSMVLGTVEVTPLALTTAYVPFANGGFTVLPNPVVSITTPSGRVLYLRDPRPLGRSISPDVLADFQTMMRTVVGEGTGRAAALPGVMAAGKTGTSQGHRDAWFVGYADGLVTGIWTGNDNNTPMDGVTGGMAPAQIWRAFMAKAQIRLSDAAPSAPYPLEQMLSMVSDDP